MLRRTLTALLTAALVLAPAAIAFAQEDTTEATTDAAAEPGLGALADLVDAIAAALGLDGVEVEGEEVEVTDEQRAAWALLIDQVLEVVKTESLVARAEAESLTDDEATEVAALEEEDEGDDEDGEEASEHGQIVRTVAHCAPRGKGMKGLFDSIANHGAIVSAAAQGGTVTLAVPVLTGEGTSVALTGEVETVEHELTTLAAAEALCADLETIATAKALSAELASDDDADATDERAERKAERDEAKADREAERAERKAERDAAKAERDAARAERAEARDRGGKGKSADESDD